MAINRRRNVIWTISKRFFRHSEQTGNKSAAEGTERTERSGRSGGTIRGGREKAGYDLKEEAILKILKIKEKVQKAITEKTENTVKGAMNEKEENTKKGADPTICVNNTTNLHLPDLEPPDGRVSWDDWCPETMQGEDPALLPDPWDDL